MSDRSRREPEGPLPRVIGVDNDRVAAIYTVASPRLIGLLTAMSGSAAEAEEVAQDAFVKLIEKWRKVSEYDDIEGWLRTVAVRLMISRHRRRQVATLGLGRLASGAETATPGPTTSRLDVAEALASLPIGSRAVVLLHHVHDLPVDEVGALLRLPVGTVKSRLSRARAAMAPMLSDAEVPTQP
ncbi:MAG: sigma-70 family RNA polymerase sigma factor [Actinomycetota bacterium]|nr:sigma-70 family RNA polymerase sigma factor [Actinomycetota bacterium]